MKKIATLSAAFAALCLMMAPASATPVFSTGLTGGSGDVQNVLLVNSLEGNPIFGQTNQTGDVVRFTSNEILATPPNGQATIIAKDGSYEFLMIQMDDPTQGFAKIQFNIDSALDGDVLLTAYFTDGITTSSTTMTFSLTGTGQNFFTIIAMPGEALTKITIDTSNSVADLQAVSISDTAQVRLDPVSIKQRTMPEPTTIGLLGLCLAGMGIATRRRRRIR